MGAMANVSAAVVASWVVSPADRSPDVHATISRLIIVSNGNIVANSMQHVHAHSSLQHPPIFASAISWRWDTAARDQPFNGPSSEVQHNITRGRPCRHERIESEGEEGRTQWRGRRFRAST